MGLRHDPEWVVAVAADPSAVDHWACPILPEEESFIWERTARLEPIVRVAQAYGGAHSDSFGGLYLDNEHSQVMTQWTADPDLHLAAMLKEAGADAPLDARLVRWTEAQLRDVQRQASRDLDWYLDYEADAEGIGADISDNVVEIEISSANPDAPRLIAERIARRLDVPVEMLRVVSDGTGLALLPWGTVKGVVTLADGSAPGRNELSVDGEPDGVGSCGGGDMGFGVRADGHFEIPCRVGRYTIVIEAPGEGDGDWVVVGEAPATVNEDETTRVRIRLVEGADIDG